MKKSINIGLVSIAILAIFLLAPMGQITPKKISEVSQNLPPTEATTLALHVSGKNIVYSNGTTATLRGVDYSWFVDTGTGAWLQSDGSTYWGWSLSDVDYFLNEMQSWGCNIIHVYGTVQYWDTDYSSFIQNLESFISAAASRGMYVEFTFWDVYSGEGEPLGLPWNQGSSYLQNVSSFVSLWINVTKTLKSYNNVLFELFNEPNDAGYDNLPSDNSANQVTWMQTTQLCLNAIRGAGVSNIVITQMGIWYRG